MPVVLMAVMWRLYSLSWGLLAGVVILYTIMLHELAHVLMARLTGGDADDVIVWPLGGLIPVQPGPGLAAAFYASVAGPAANLLLALFCMYPLYSSGELLPLLNPFAGFTVGENDTVAQTAVRMAFVANWCVALINLLPVLPLDGGHLLRAFLGRRFSDPETRDILLRIGLAGSLIGMLAGFVLDVSGVVALSAFVLVLHIHEAVRSYQPPARDESFMGYDFSEGYTSLDRSSPDWNEAEAGDTEQQDDFARTGILERWKSRREEERQRREEEERQQEEKQMDAILEKLHTQGRDALNASELHVLDRASQRLRRRNANT